MEGCFVTQWCWLLVQRVDVNDRKESSIVLPPQCDESYLFKNFLQRQKSWDYFFTEVGLDTWQENLFLYWPKQCEFSLSFPARWQQYMEALPGHTPHLEHIWSHRAWLCPKSSSSSSLLFSSDVLTMKSEVSAAPKPKPVGQSVCKAFPGG